MSTPQYQLESVLKIETASKNVVMVEQQENECVVEKNSLSEQLDIPPADFAPHAPQTTLEHIIETKEKISQVKDSLGSIIDTMAQNPSLFNQAATYYGELPLWKKLVIGVGLSVPTLAVGVFAEIGVLLVISGVTVVAYTATGIVLEDHHHCNVNIADRLKKGIISLADVLELTIKALDSIGEKLAEEVEKFKLENMKLAENVSELTYQVESLSSQVEIFIEIERLLRQTKEDLEESTAILKQSSVDQASLLKQNQEELAKVTRQYKLSQMQLSEKVTELKGVRILMDQEIEKVSKLSITLESTVSTLSKVVIEDSNDRKAFQKKLQKFLGDNEADFIKVLTSLRDTGEGLHQGKEEFERANQRYNELLSKQEELIGRLEIIDKKIATEHALPKESMASLLNLNGIYANKSLPVSEVIKDKPKAMQLR